MTKLFGCEIQTLGNIESTELVRRAVEGGASSNFHWLLAHCFDGVVWGRADKTGWRLSSTVFPEISPQVAEGNLMELRIFNDNSEALVWRHGDEFRGRKLIHSASGIEMTVAPCYEERVLLGNRVLKPTADGFTLVGDATGSRHPVPLECTDNDFVQGNRRGISPLRLGVWNYFEREEDEHNEGGTPSLPTGAVRVAVSRLAAVWKEPKHV